MSDHGQTNVVLFYSKLEPFRVAEKYTDVTIKCDSECFKSHRVTLAAASEFFDATFTSDFKERKEGIVELPEISAETFGEVLQFIYTGSVSITSANVCQLFKASEFLLLTGIADLCLEFVKKNKMTVNITLRMYSLACQHKNVSLIDILSKDIIKQVKIFAKADMFLEIPFENLKIILEKLSASSTKNEEVLFSTIYEWLSHRQEERSIYSDQLYKMVRFGCISTEVTGFIISKFYHKDTNALERRVETADPVGEDEFTVIPRETVSTMPAQKLHLFVKYAEENFVQIFSKDSEMNEFTSSGKIHFKHDLQWIRTVAMDDYLYCLHYNRRNSEKIESNQIFSAYTSVHMRSPLELNAPPVVFGDVNLCRGRNNNIYVYNQTVFQPFMRTDSTCSAMFTDEEMSRGIYLYNADLDVWLPVPVMRRKVQDACMTTYNGSLYLIGGTSDSADDCISPKFVQTYDCREGTWEVLPSTNFNRVGAACCALRDGIFVCGGISQTTSAERYDPRMRKWENLDQSMDKELQYHQLIPYCEKLWAIGSFIPGGVSFNALSIQYYQSCVTTTVPCKSCTSNSFYYPDTFDTPFSKRPRFSNGFQNQIYIPEPRHHDHKKEVCKSFWGYGGTLQEQGINNSTAGVILDGIVF